MTGPVYFISHGGPPTLFDVGSPAHEAFKAVGVRIEEDIASGTIRRDKGLICVSAHWENKETESGVLVNVDQSNPLIYDFYNFPAHYYTQTFDSSHRAGNVEDVKSALMAAGIDVAERRRGLDHGLWVPFKVFFPKAPTVPILQISLPAPPYTRQRPGDYDQRYAEESVKLGRSIHALREMGYGIMATGQFVHNLRAYRTGTTPISKALFDSFYAASRTAVTTPAPASPVIELFSRADYRNAHPTAEHLIPLAVAAGAAEGENARCPQRVEELFEMADGPLGWWMGRWE